MLDDLRLARVGSCAVFAERSPGARDPLVLLDSTPVDAGRSLDTARRSAMADAAGYAARVATAVGSSRSAATSMAARGVPSGLQARCSRKPRKREIARDYLLPRLAGHTHTIIADKGYAGRELAESAATLGITIIRPARANEPKHAHLPRLTTSAWSMTGVS